MHHVLLVEDDTDLRELVAAVLGDAGYEVTEAANGQEALDLLRAGLSPCVILLDLMMPVLSGPELLEILSEDTELRDLPVVVVSAIAGLGGAVPGVRKFLCKPVSQEILRATVAEFCTARAPSC